ncbi:MAG: MMPL family transporter, partial [Streptomyces sp.]
MFEALGRVVYRRRRWVVAAALLLVAAAGVWGTGVFGKLTGAGFDDPGSESAHAAQVAAASLGRDGSDVVVLYSSRSATVDDPAFRDAVTQTLDALPADEVARSVTWWSTGAAPLVSKDRHATYAVLTLAPDGDATAVRDAVRAPGLTTRVGGNAVVNDDINSRVSADIGRAESISMPVLLILLVVIFGSLAAASLPLAIGGTAILGSFAALRAFSSFTDVSVFAVNVVTIM